MYRLFNVKRIIALFSCTLLLFMSIFMSYCTAVHADDDYNLKDAVYNVLDIICIIGGLLVVPETGGLSLLASAKGILDIADDAENIYKYVTKNGDGTYTIDANFIQNVIDATIFIENQGFTDDDIIKQKNGTYDLRYVVVDNDSKCGVHYVKEVCKYEGLEYMNGLSACRIIPYSETGYYILSVYYANGATHITEYRRMKNSCGYVYNSSSIGFIGQSYGANVPIFSDYTAMMNYLSTGTGYKDAINYRPTPLFRRHSAYTPTYSGGSVTVNRTVINNINQKITEVDSDDSLTVDQKIEILQQYIFSGGTSGTGGGGGSGSGDKDIDYDDNKDLPSGTDLTDTNSWLKKIYLKVCQIYDKMNSAVEDAALDKIFKKIDEFNENFKSFFIFEDAPGINARYMSSLLERILEQLRGIGDDLGDIKDQLEDMSEQEFSDQTETFLDDAMGSFSEISEKAKGKFPFSIPNDIRLLISKMSVSPPEDPGRSTYSVQNMSFDADAAANDMISVLDESGGDLSAISETGAPVFYLPFVIASAGIEQYVLIDLSGFEPVSRFCRSLMTIFFILCLFNLTFKVMGLWGDLVD